MKKYDTYKDSGNQWIGQVPEHWAILPMKHCANLFTGNSISDKDKENYSDASDAYPYIATKDINVQTLLADYENGMYTKKEDASFKIASKGSTLLCIEGGSAGRKKTYLTEDVSFVNKLCCFTAKDAMSGKYLYYYINSNEFVEMFNNHITGLIGGVSLSQLVNFKAPLPPLTEQEAIANFLDKKTGEIDQAIALFEQEKTDLQAYRKAIISETVTKGLNPNAKLKDSGIQWIGQIPEEWKTPKLSYITSKIGSGSTPRGGAETYVTSGVKFIRSQNVYDTGLRLEDVVCITDEVNESMKNSQVQVGDILYNITGGSIGRCYIVDDSLGPANVNQHVCIVRPCNVYGRFLLYNLQSEVSQYQLRILQSGGNREGLTAEAFKDFIIPLPPLSEQEAIVAYLDKKTSAIDTAIERINAQITELQTYRTALISEAVTGKIDVR